MAVLMLLDALALEEPEEQELLLLCGLRTAGKCQDPVAAGCAAQAATERDGDAGVGAGSHAQGQRAKPHARAALARAAGMQKCLDTKLEAAWLICCCG